MVNNKLTFEEIQSIASQLDDVIADHFHDAIWNTISERETDYHFEVCDEDIIKIKELLKLYL